VALPELTISAWLRFDAIQRGLASAAPARLLEIGAGEGALGAWLAARCEYVGVEPDAQSREMAARRLRAVGRGEVRAATALPDRRRPYDMVCAFEVLEHIEDDAAALRCWRDQLADGGHLLLSVPAHPARFGPSDRYVGHVRRYDRQALAGVLAAAGFEIREWRSYGAGLGHALDAARNAVLRRRGTGRDAAEGTALSGRLFQPRSRPRVLFNYLAAVPFRVLQAPFASSDVGIGYVVLAQAVRPGGGFGDFA
jgi:SAM-dependent methyltransferase